jgi:hypothetical protein
MVMNEAIVCKPSPVKILAVSAAPLRELLNFLIYRRHSELLTERARRQPVLFLEKIPSTANELKGILKAERLGKNGKMFFDRGKPENHILICLNFRSVEKTLRGFI